MSPVFLRAVPDGVLLAVKVVPRAACDELVGVLGTELKIKLTAPPVDSAANQALVVFLAGALGCPKSSVRLVKGQTARRKTVHIHGMTLEGVANALKVPSAG